MIRFAEGKEQYKPKNVGGTMSFDIEIFHIILQDSNWIRAPLN